MEQRTVRCYISLCEPEQTVLPMKDAEVKELAVRVTGCNDLPAVQQMKKEKCNAVLSSLKAAGLSVRQIERLTGINRNIIQRAE